MKLVCLIVIWAAAATAAYSQGETASPGMTTTASSRSSMILERSSTSIYRIGFGDQLTIAIGPGAKGERSYSVRGDGTIDFPLSGGNVRAVGRTVEELGSFLSNTITVYRVPKVTVRVSEFVSHGVSVAGLVDLPGTHQIQRDSVPLYVIRAMTGVRPNAMLAEIARADGRKESHLLHNSESDAVAIYPGDRIEFKEGDDSDAVGYYFLRLAVAEKKPLPRGLTLSQIVRQFRYKIAEVASYGNGNELERREFNLREIARGKVADPVIRQGDIVSFR